MRAEQRQLLIKDLCSRLPYGVKVQVNRVGEWDGETKRFVVSKELTFDDVKSLTKNGTVSDIKPYLRPMDTMTEEEAVEYFRLQKYYEKDYEYAKVDGFTIDSNKCLCAYVDNAWCQYCWGDVSNIKTLDWLLEKHFDFRGLIWDELALPATEGMYNF